mgnify:CR=1 FL=1
MRLGQVVQLLDRAAEADAGQLAAAERDQRVRELVALAERVGERVEVGEDALASPLGPIRRPLERLASRVGDRTMLLDVARISHFSAKDKLTFAVVNGREHVIDQTLAQLEEQLDARRFVRIHRATIVNLAAVSELHTADDEGVVVRLKDDGRTQLSVARDRVRVLKERLGI